MSICEQETAPIEEAGCPECIPDPNAIIPNWKSLPIRIPVYRSPEDPTKLGIVSNPFFNGRKCQYSIVVLSEYEGAGCDSVELEKRLNETLETAVRGLLRYYGKVETDGEGGTVESLQEAATVSGHYISPRYKIKMKVLVSIDFEDFSKIDDIRSIGDEPLLSEIESPDGGDEDLETTTVSYRPDDLLQYIFTVTQAFRVFNANQAVFEKTKNGYVVFSGPGQYFDYGTQRKLMQDVLPSLNDFLDSRGYTKLSPAAVKSIRSLFNPEKKVIGEIEFEFDSKFNLKSISLNERGCGPANKEKFNVEYLGLASDEPWSDRTTMRYLSDLEDMSADIFATERMPWQDFTVKYTYPAVTIRYDNNIEVTDQDTGEIIEIDLGSTIFTGIVSAADVIADSWNEYLCMNPDQFQEFQAQVIANEQSILSVATETMLRLEEIDQTIWDNWQEIKKEATAGDPKALWDMALNKVGLCNFLKLRKKAIECLMAGLTYNEGLKVIVDAAIEGLSVSDYGRLFALLPASTQLNLTDEVKLVLGVPEFSPPWESEQEDVEIDAPYVDYGDQNFILGATTADTEETMSALKEALIAQTQTIDDLENLIASLGRIPGIELLSDFIEDLDCAIPSPPGVPISTIATSGMPSLCNSSAPLSFNISRFNIFKNFFKRPGKDQFAPLITVIKSRISSLLANLMISIIDQAMQAIYEAVCDQVSEATDTELELEGGGLDDDLFSPLTNSNPDYGDSDYLIGIINESFLDGNGSDEQLTEITQELLSMVLNTDNVSSETLNVFVTDLSVCLKAKEMAELFLGIENNAAIQIVLDLVKGHYEELKPMFSGPIATQSFFKNLGATFSSDIKQSLAGNLDNLNNDPVYASSVSGCSNKDQLQIYRDYRLQALTSKDCTPSEQASEMYCQQVEDLKQQIKDLLQKIPDPSNPPSCDDENSIVVQNPDVLIEATGQLLTSLTDSIERAFDNDMIGREGFLNMVLSDTYSMPWRRHKRKYNRNRFYVNYREQWEDQFGETKWWPFLGGLLGKLLHGYYPITVAEYLSDQLEKITPANIDVFLNTPTTNTVSIPAFDFDEFGLPILNTASFAEEKNPDIIMNYKDNNNGVTPESGEVSFNYGFRIENSNYVPGHETVDITRTKIIDIDAEYNDDLEAETTSRSVVADMYVTGSLPSRVYDLLTSYDIVLTDDIKSPQQCVFYNFIAKTMSNTGYRSISVNDAVNILGATYHRDLFTEKMSEIANDIRTNGLDLSPAFLYGFDSGSAINNSDLRYYDPFVELSNGDVVNIRSQYDTHYYNPENPPEGLEAGLELNFYGAYMFKQILLQNGIDFDELKVTDIGELLSYTTEIATARKIMEDTKILGISENERVYFLDADEYGGRYAQPQIYVEPRKDTGWLGLSQAIVPEQDGCDPRTVDIVDFNDIKEKVQEIFLSAPTDIRVEADSDCILEKPYFKVLERLPMAGLEGSVMAIIRIYVLEVMLQAMPVFSKYEAVRNKVIDDTVIDYVISIMETDLKIEGQNIRNPINLLRGDNYWYGFLEQCVQVYRRRYNAGEVELTSDALLAISSIDALLPQYETPTRDTFERDKELGVTERRTFRRYKHDKVVEFIKLTEDHAKTLMKILVYEQFEVVSNNFKLSLGDISMAPSIDNIDNRVFGSEIIEVDGSYEDKVFVLQRYVYLEPKQGVNFPVPLPLLGNQTKGVISFVEWENWISDVNSADPTFCQQPLSEYFGDLQTEEDESGTVISSQGSVGVRYGIRQLWVTSDPSIVSSLSANGDSTVGQQLRAFDYDPVTFALPLVDAELDAANSPLNSIDVGESYNEECLLKDLYDKSEWMLLWKYSLSLPRIVSLLSIYTAKGFLPSIGQKLGENEGGDGPIDFFKDLFTADVSNPTTGASSMILGEGDSIELDENGLPVFPTPTSGGIIGGEWDNESSSTRGFTYYDWDQDLLRKSKRAVRRMFSSFWNYRGAPSFDFDLEFKLDIKKDLRKLMEFGLSGAKIKWPLRRRLTDRPFDKDGEECD